MTIFLCGFMGCGKSALAHVLSKKLGIAEIDMDDYIVKKNKMTIPEIFEKYGEDYFRHEEEKAVLELRDKNAVIACGGGTMQNNINAKNARETGEVIYLNQTFEVCYDRIKDDKNRPLVVNNTKESLHEIYNKRSDIYKKNSSMEIIPGDTPIETANKVIDELKMKADFKLK